MLFYEAYWQHSLYLCVICATYHFIIAIAFCQLANSQLNKGSWHEIGLLSVNFMSTRAKWRSFFTIIRTVLPIPGHLIVPDCFCPRRGTHTRDSGTVPGIPGQLVTLSTGLANIHIDILQSRTFPVAWYRVLTGGRLSMPSPSRILRLGQYLGIPSLGGGYWSHRPRLQGGEGLVADECGSSAPMAACRCWRCGIQ